MGSRSAVACDFPPESALPGIFGAFGYSDSFAIGLDRSELKMHEIYLGIFGHIPSWLKSLLVVRNAIVSPFGISGPTMHDMNHIEFRDSYAVGDKIVRWTLYAQTADEIVSGMNDKHLDFRVSLFRQRIDRNGRVVLSTAVKTHNRFGQFYLRTILPFHRIGVTRLLENAAEAERI